MKSRKRSQGQRLGRCLRALSDSVAAVPDLGGEDSAALRAKCVAYAVPRADANPAAAGAVLAWVARREDVLDADKVAQLLSVAFEDQAIAYRTLAAMVEAHGGQRPVSELESSDSKWTPCAGVGLETIAARAAREIQLRAPSFDAAVDLLAAVVRPDGGAHLSDASCRAALLATADCLRKGDRDASQIVTAMLSKKVGDIDRLPHVIAFVGAAISWGSPAVAKVSVAFVKDVDQSVRESYAKAVLDELEGAVRRPGVDLEELALLWGRVVEGMCADAPEHLVMMHSKLLERFGEASQVSIVFPVSFLVSIVENIPLKKLYGGFNETRFDASRFLAGYRVLSAHAIATDGDACVQMEKHIDALPSALRADLATEAMRRIFGGQDRLLLGIISRAVTPRLSNSSDEGKLTENAVASLLRETYDLQKSGEMDTKVCVLAVEVLEICTACTKREALDCFRETLELATSAIRRDANSKLAQFGVMLLSAALVSNSDPSLTDLPAWLIDLVNTALRAIRRYQESMSRVPAASNKSKKGSMPSSPLGAGAVLMSRAIEALDEGALNSDEWRFWTIAVQDALMDAQYANSERRENQCAVANLGALALSLVQADEDGVAPQKIESDDICRRGAWAAVNFLPALDKRGRATESSVSGDEILPANPSGLARLAIMAAERGTLVSHEEGLVLSRDKVYALVPLLASPRRDVRRAVLVNTSCTRQA